MDHMSQQNPWPEDPATDLAVSYSIAVAASRHWVWPIPRFIFARFLVSMEINGSLLTGAETPVLGLSAAEWTINMCPRTDPDKDATAGVPQGLAQLPIKAAPVPKETQPQISPALVLVCGGIFTCVRGGGLVLFIVWLAL